jgi:hypothetical protein
MKPICRSEGNWRQGKNTQFSSEMTAYFFRVTDVESETDGQLGETRLLNQCRPQLLIDGLGLANALWKGPEGNLMNLS